MPHPTRKYDRSLNSEVERLLYQCEVVEMDAKGLVAPLSETQIDWTPEPNRWSVGQCIEHLNLTSRKSLPLFEEAIERGRKDGITGDGPYAYGFLSRMFLRMVEPPAKLKVRAPKPFQPGPEYAAGKVLEVFLADQQRTAALLRAANGLDLARIKVPSAFSNLVKYPLGMGFWILFAHERRHIRQARELCRHPEFPRK